MSGFYTAATAMLIQQRRLNTTANNIANVKTTGYKSERTVTQSFNDVLVGRQTKNSITPIGYASPLSVIDAVNQTFDMADLEETTRPFDVAIGGDGFFNIEKDGQIYLTRNGAFELNDEGYLALKGAGTVMGQAGAIQLENSSFTINEKGELFNSTGELVDTLLVTVPDDMSSLKKTNTGMYVANENVQMAESTALIYQGHLERSNVDLNQELANMIEIQRSFQSVSNALKTIDELNGRAINEIGKL